MTQLLRVGYERSRSGPNDDGNNPSIDIVSTVPVGVVAWICVDESLNSRIRWRQPPHGVPGVSPAATVTISAMTGTSADWATIIAIAPASAQVPSGYDAFSTLQPVNTSPAVVRIAAPTGNLEYGLCDLSRTALAAWNKSAVAEE
jgi:hypothetical protein